MSARHRRLRLSDFRRDVCCRGCHCIVRGCDDREEDGRKPRDHGLRQSGDDVTGHASRSRAGRQREHDQPERRLQRPAVPAALASGQRAGSRPHAAHKVALYAAKGALQPLDACIKSQKSTEQYRKAAVQRGTYGGQVYGLPEFTNRDDHRRPGGAEDAGLSLADARRRRTGGPARAGGEEAGHVDRRQARRGSASTRRSTRTSFPLWAKFYGATSSRKDGLKAAPQRPAGASQALHFTMQLINAQGGWNKFKSFRDTWDFFGSDNPVAKDQLGSWPMEQFILQLARSTSPNVARSRRAVHEPEGRPDHLLQR